MLAIQTPEDNEYFQVNPNLKFKWPRLFYRPHAGFNLRSLRVIAYYLTETQIWNLQLSLSMYNFSDLAA